MAVQSQEHQKSKAILGLYSEFEASLGCMRPSKQTSLFSLSLSVSLSSFHLYFLHVLSLHVYIYIYPYTTHMFIYTYM